MFRASVPALPYQAALTGESELLANEITVFKDVVRIDVQTSTPRLDFPRAWANRETMRYRGQPFFVASKSDLIAAKRASAHERDIEDIKLLELPDETERLE